MGANEGTDEFYRDTSLLFTNMTNRYRKQNTLGIQGCYCFGVDGVFPVYHPGANSKRNRGVEQQVEDWKRIKGYYDGVK